MDKLHTLIYGSTGQIVFDFKPTSNSSDTQLVISTIISLAQNGYNLTNPEVLFLMSNEDLKQFNFHFQDLITSFTKEAFYLRKTFAKSVNLEAYTDDDWLAIFAHYSQTYGWSNKYAAAFGITTEDTLSNYLGNVLNEIPEPIPVANIKNITIISKEGMIIYLTSIINNPSPLRQHQMDILNAAMLSDLIEAQSYADIKIKATEALVNNLIYNKGGIPKIISVDSMMRFILTNGQKGDNKEDYTKQILKPSLKSFKFHLPTRMKKFILTWFNNRKEPYKVTEELIKYEQWWKRMFKHCHWCNEDKFDKRYPMTSSILEVLYSKDRTWTFNSRYQAALNDSCYNEGINLLAQERPGLLLRNLVMYAKYTQGVQLPLKQESKPRNSITELLSAQTPKVVKYDAKIWIKDNFTKFLNEKKPTVKTCWEAINELLDPKHLEPIYERVVQGKTITYSVPIPAIHLNVRDNLVHQLGDYIYKTKSKDNSKYKEVYIDESLKDLVIQFSGSSDTSNQCSGQYIAPGSFIPVPKSGFLRMGVAWKDVGHGSCDVDLSSALVGHKNIAICYYCSPEIYTNKDLLAVSSGDITSCGNSIYSAEFIDIDIDKCKQHGVTNIINSLIMHSGRTLDMYDTHTFFSVIKAKDRVTSGRKVKIELDKQDYAIKLNEPSKGYIGFNYNLEQDKIQILSIPQHVGIGTDLQRALPQVKELINQMPQRLSLYDILIRSFNEDSLVTQDEITEDTLTISTKGTGFSIEAYTQLEEINKLIF